MDYKIALIPGDGIGPEIVGEAKKVLDKVCEKYGHNFSYSEVLLGGASIDVHGVPLTDEAIATAKSSDAVLMGSIGGDAKTSPWYKLEPSKRPEAGLLAIRKALNLFANLRPAYLYNELKKACPLRDEIIGEGFDMIIVRELTGGLYFGERKTIEENGVKKAIDTLSYNENEIQAVFKGGREDEVMLLHELMAADIPVYSFVRDRSSLETLFMQITDREVKEHAYESGL